MPVLIQRIAQRVPEEHENMAAIVFGLIRPSFREPRRHVFEEVPLLMAVTDGQSTKGNQGYTCEKAAFFPEFSDSCVAWAFSDLNGSLHELLARRRVCECQHFSSPVA